MSVVEAAPELTPEQQEWVKQFQEELHDWTKGQLATEDTLGMVAATCRRQFWETYEIEVQVKATWRWTCCVVEKALPGGGVLLGYYCDRQSEDGVCPDHGEKMQNRDTIHLDIVFPRVFIATVAE